MADIGATVTTQLLRFGQPCTVRWPAKGTGALALPAQQQQSLVRIKSRSFVNASGTLQTIIEGMMPATDRNLQGATLLVGTRTYTVSQNIEKVYLGKVIYQTVVLV